MGKIRQKQKLILAGCCLVSVCSIIFAVTQQILFARKAPQVIRKIGYNVELIGKPLPNIELANFSGKTLGDGEFRKGKVLITLLSPECESCLVEGKFLGTVIEKYSNFRFYGVLVFWKGEDISKTGEKFPISLKLFLDKDYAFVKALGVKSVPLKIYLEDGITTKIWQGASNTQKNELSFLNDLDEISKK